MAAMSMALIVHLLAVKNLQACDHITLSVPWSFDRTLNLLELIHKKVFFLFFFFFEKKK